MLHRYPSGNHRRLIPLVKWTDTMIFILDQKGLDEVGTPVVRYLWFIFPSHMEWFLEHIADWDILCFVGTEPWCWGLDIRSERIGHSRLYELVTPVITEYGLHIGKAKAKFELE